MTTDTTDAPETIRDPIRHAWAWGTSTECGALGLTTLLNDAAINCPACLDRIAAKAARRERVRLDRLAPHELHPTTLEFIGAMLSCYRFPPEEVLDVVYRGGMIARGSVPSTLHVAVLIEAHLRGRVTSINLGEHSGDGVHVNDLGPEVVPPCLCHLDRRAGMQPWEEPRWSLACPLPRPNQPPMMSSRSAL